MPQHPSDEDLASDNDAFAPPLPPGAPAWDDLLNHAHVLTVEEVVQRRARRLRHLLRMYRAQYWGLLEEMRSKYRRFYLRHGKSGRRHDGREDEPDHATANHTPSTPGEMKQPHAPEKPGTEILRCGAQGCLAKPMLLSSYCYTHILQEPRQRLYKPCSYIVRRGSGKNGNVLCEKPVLQAVSPPLCPTHFQQTQKQSARSLRKAGIVLPPGSFTMSAPKLHHFVAEYVRVIQAKRRALRIARVRGETTASAHREPQGCGSVAGTSRHGAGLRNIHRKDAEEQFTENARAGEANKPSLV